MNALVIDPSGADRPRWSPVARAEAQPGDVLVRITAVGLAWGDVLQAQGKYSGGPSGPFVPGHEFVGEVVGFGDCRPSLDYAIGDRIFGLLPRGGALADLVAAPATWFDCVPRTSPMPKRPRCRCRSSPPTPPCSRWGGSMPARWSWCKPPPAASGAPRCNSRRGGTRQIIGTAGFGEPSRLRPQPRGDRRRRLRRPPRRGRGGHRRSWRRPRPRIRRGRGVRLEPGLPRRVRSPRHRRSIVGRRSEPHRPGQALVPVVVSHGTPPDELDRTAPGTRGREPPARPRRAHPARLTHPSSARSSTPRTSPTPMTRWAIAR